MDQINTLERPLWLITVLYHVQPLCTVLRTQVTSALYSPCLTYPLPFTVVSSKLSGNLFQSLRKFPEICELPMPISCFQVQHCKVIRATGNSRFKKTAKFPPQSKNIPEYSRYWNNHFPSSQQHFIQLTTLQTCSELYFIYLFESKRAKRPLTLQWASCTYIKYNKTQ